MVNTPEREAFAWTNLNPPPFGVYTVADHLRDTGRDHPMCRCVIGFDPGSDDESAIVCGFVDNDGITHILSADLSTAVE